MTAPTPPGVPADDPWGDPIGSLTLEWATPPVEASPPATPEPNLSPAPTAVGPAGRSGRIRYAVGPTRRTKSLVELLFVAAILAAVFAALLGAGVAALVGVVHRTVRSN